MSMKFWQPIAIFIDRLLSPIGLIMWTEYSFDDDGLRVVGVSFGRRPNLDRARWEASQKSKDRA
jgi:hypothetical protein